jgi:hypothetical protein
MDADRPSSNKELSPYQWDSTPSDGHSSNTTVPASRNARNLTAGQRPAVVSHKRMDSLEAPSSIRPVSKTKGSGGDSPGLKRASAVVRRSSLPYEDEDAVIVANSAARHETRGARPQPKQTNSSAVDTAARMLDKPKDRDNGWEDVLPSMSSSDNSVRSGVSKETTYTSPMLSRGNNSPVDKQTVIASNDTTPRAQKTRLVEKRGSNEPEDEVDSSISAAAALAARYESSETMQPNKVMTRAQFERYQREQDERRMLSGKPDDDESDISDYEEESEVEKSKEIARQRARQEAHLSVYRQQMMKISGTDPADTPLAGRPASISSPALPLSLSSVDPGSSGKNSDEEEDEEIPLGILLAHGFPSRNRPPTRLSTASSQPNLRASAQAGAQRDSHLPPFARHLPADPYNVGASIVNPMNRMSLAFGVGNDARSVAGGSVYNGAPPSQLPSRAPQGLVGEIVRAEEMKAARRGGHSQFMQSQVDPFKQDPLDRHNGGRLGFGAQQGGMGGMGSGTVGTSMGMGMGGNNMGPGTGPVPPGMGMQGGINQSDAMQAQMANMQQYMQMQMQMMQMQMQQLQGSSQPQQQQLMAPMMSSMQRPTSMMSLNPPVGGLGTLPQGPPRTMSMIDNQFPQLQTGNGASYIPSVTAGLMQPPANNGFLGPQGYTPSIAPSERSNVGLPSRYRPVSHQPGPAGGARSATFTSTTAQDWNRKSAGPSHLKNASTDEDEDDESGWEALSKRRKEKIDDRRKKKEAGGLQGILSFGSSAASSNTSTA